MVKTLKTVRKCSDYLIWNRETLSKPEKELNQRKKSQRKLLQNLTEYTNFMFRTSENTKTKQRGKTQNGRIYL